MLARIRTSIDEKDQGFTLIELLVVMIIIAILSAIAIPVFLNQRQKAVDSSTRADLKTVADFEETYFVDNSVYADTAAALAGIKLSKGTQIYAKAVTGGYCLRGWNASGTTTATNTFWYDSTSGGMAAGAATATAPTGACTGISGAATATISGP